MTWVNQLKLKLDLFSVLWLSFSKDFAHSSSSAHIHTHSEGSLEICNDLDYYFVSIMTPKISSKKDEEVNHVANSILTHTNTQIHIHIFKYITLTCSAVLLNWFNPLTSAPFCNNLVTSVRFPLAEALQSRSSKLALMSAQCTVREWGREGEVLTTRMGINSVFILLFLPITLTTEPLN